MLAVFILFTLNLLKYIAIYSILISENLILNASGIQANNYILQGGKNMKKYLSMILSATLMMSTFLTSGIQAKAATTTKAAATNTNNANLLNTYGKVFGKVGTTLNASQISDSECNKCYKEGIQ